LKAERQHQKWIIAELDKDIDFHKESIKLFGKLMAEYIFTKNSGTRKQLNEIIAFHQQEIARTKDEIRFSERVIEKTKAQIETPDGQKY